MNFYDTLLVVLLWQSVGKGEEEVCANEGHIRQWQAVQSSDISIQYCSEGSWYYLCSGGAGWTSTLATVVCRQLKLSDQGASRTVVTVNGSSCSPPKAFRLFQACTGTENNISECGEVKLNEVCRCGQVAEITCQPKVSDVQGADTTTTAIMPPVSSSQVNVTTTLHIDTTSITYSETVAITNKTHPPRATDQDSEIITIALAAAIGVLVALITVILIVACVVVYKKKSTQHQQSHQSGSAKENECYSLRQLDDPVYDEASSAQPNYSSLGPTYDMEGGNAQHSDSYDYIEHTINTPQAEPANSTPPRMEASENDFYDAEQHTYAVVNANKKKKGKKTSGGATNDTEATVNAQDIAANPTPVRDDDSKNEDGFYDAEEHTYSVVNAKCKKKVNKKPPEDEKEMEESCQ